MDAIMKAIRLTAAWLIMQRAASESNRASEAATLEFDTHGATLLWQELFSKVGEAHQVFIEAKATYEKEAACSVYS